MPNPSSWQSVADRISELERQQTNTSTVTATANNHNNDQTTLSQPSHMSSSASVSSLASSHHRPYNYPASSNTNGNNTSTQKFTFLDPSKTTRISNPALKAFQKNAVQSYFERQQLSQPREPVSATSTTNITTRQSISGAGGGGSSRPQSLPVVGSPTKTLPAQQITQHTRSSLPSNYVTAHTLLPPHQTPGNGHLSPNHARSSSSSNCGDSPTRSPARSHSHSSPVLTNCQTAALNISPATQALSSYAYQAAFQQATATFNGLNSANDNIANGIPTTSIAFDGSVPCSAVTEQRDNVTVAAGTGCNGATMTTAVCDDFMNESGVPPPPPRRNRSLMPVRR